jgi:hypothetical protein
VLCSLWEIIARQVQPCGGDEFGCVWCRVGVKRGGIIKVVATEVVSYPHWSMSRMDKSSMAKRQF